MLAQLPLGLVPHLENPGSANVNYSQQAKVGVKVKKIKEQAKKDQRINGKHQREFSLSHSLSLLLGLNTALTIIN